MKKILNGLLSLLIIFTIVNLTFVVYADDNNISLSGEDSKVEKKTICKVSINDDFVPDEIIVRFSNSKSRELNEFSV